MTAKASEPTVWRMKLGRKGVFESEALEESIIVIGFGIHTNLHDKDDEEIRDIVNKVYPGQKPGQRRNHFSQLRAFVNRMKIGDLVAVALKTQIGFLAIGRITGDYAYVASRTDTPHTRTVEWLLPSVSIAPVFSNQLHFVHGRRTLNQIRDQGTCETIRRAVMSPGALEDHPEPPTEEDATDLPDLMASASAQIAQLIHDRFPDSKLEELVAGVLEAEGYTIAPLMSGPDQGVDVLAGHGLLGFDPPLVCVQVKHEKGPTGAAAVQQLRGAVEDFGAQQALFVSWSGYTRGAEREARRNFFRLRLWDGSDLIDAVCRNYDNLSAELRAEIPLQQIWAVAPEDSV